LKKTAERISGSIEETVGEGEIFSKGAAILTNFLQTFNKIITTFLLLKIKLFIEI